MKIELLIDISQWRRSVVIRCKCGHESDQHHLSIEDEVLFVRTFSWDHINERLRSILTTIIYNKWGKQEGVGLNITLNLTGNSSRRFAG